MDRAKPGRVRLTLGQAVPLRLTTGGRIRFEISMDVVGEVGSPDAPPIGVRVSGYFFHVTEYQHREILAYHWHPDGVSPVTTPHLHLSSRLPDIAVSEGVEISLSAVHLPTGEVSAQDIVRLLITEFGVEPRRSDWRTIVSSR